jgi:hypothetical protein
LRPQQKIQITYILLTEQTLNWSKKILKDALRIVIPLSKSMQNFIKHTLEKLRLSKLLVSFKKLFKQSSQHLNWIQKTKIIRKLKAKSNRRLKLILFYQKIMLKGKNSTPCKNGWRKEVLNFQNFEWDFMNLHIVVFTLQRTWKWVIRFFQFLKINWSLKKMF